MKKAKCSLSTLEKTKQGTRFYTYSEESDAQQENSFICTGGDSNLLTIIIAFRLFFLLCGCLSWWNGVLKRNFTPLCDCLCWPCIYYKKDSKKKNLSWDSRKHCACDLVLRRVKAAEGSKWIINFYCVELTNIFIEIRDP